MQTGSRGTKRRRRALGPLAIVVGLLLAGCGSDEPEPRTQAELIEDGEAVYASNCALCHGGDLRGTDRGPSHRHPLYDPTVTSDEAYRAAITQGVPQKNWPFGPMPAVNLDDDEIDAVIAYIREVQRQLGFEE